jgi:hypothetical protein
MISLSASTAQMLEMGCGFSARNAISPTSPSSICRYLAARTMKLPEPAAHLSLVLKPRTLPFSASAMARVHWLPISSTAEAEGKR